MQICGSSSLTFICIIYIFLKGVLCILLCSFVLFHTNCFSVAISVNILIFLFCSFSVIFSCPVFCCVLFFSSWSLLSFTCCSSYYLFHFFSPPLFIHLSPRCTLFPASHASSPSLHDIFYPFILPPAPRVLYLGRRASVGLLLRDLGGKWLRSQPASTGGEPLQCASEDSQVDPDQLGPLWLCSTPFCLFLPFSSCFLLLVLVESWSAEALLPLKAWLV